MTIKKKNINKANAQSIIRFNKQEIFSLGKNLLAPVFISFFTIIDVTKKYESSKNAFVIELTLKLNLAF
jgi:hypothetical protein